MIYSITCDGESFYSPTLMQEGYGVIEPKLTVELNKAGSLEFALPENNIIYNKIEKLKSDIMVFQEDEELFRGRVLHDERDLYKQKKVYCEGELAFFLDSITEPYVLTTGVRETFKYFLANHNAQVDEGRRFILDEITVTDPNDYIRRENNSYSNTSDELNAKLVNTLGGYLKTRGDKKGNRYISYLTEYGGTSGQTIEFGSNLLDLSEYISAEDVFTVLYPVGAEVDTGNEVKEKVKIGSVNGGRNYIEDAEAIKRYGRIWKVEEWQDVTLPANLLAKAKEYLKNGIQMATTITIKAVDLHLLNVNTDRLRLGDHIRVISLPHNLDRLFLCSRIVYDLAHPEKTEYTLGSTFKSLTDKQLSNSQGLIVQMNNMRDETNVNINNVREEMYNLPMNNMTAITNIRLEEILT